MSFPKGEVPVNITLYNNVPFSNSYSDHLFRPSGFHKGSTEYDDISMERFLDVLDEDQAYKFSRTTLTDNFNFDYGNGLVTSIVLEVPSGATSSNYMKVKYNIGLTTRYLYFFITNVTELSANGNNCTCKFELELDVLATYDGDMLNRLQDMPLNVERKHCQRYALDGNSFSCKDLILAEPSMYCEPNIVDRTERLTISNQPNTYWLYLTIAGDGNNLETTTINEIEYPVGTIALPITRTFEVRLTGTGATNLQLSPTIIKSMYDNVNNVSAKVSPFSPFGDWSLLGGSLSSNRNVYSTGSWVKLPNETISSVEYEVWSVGSGDNWFKLYRRTTTPYTTFMKVSEVKSTKYTHNYKSILNFAGKPTLQDEKSYDYEPKMYCSPYYKVVLKSLYAEEVEYKLQYLLLNKKNNYYVQPYSIASVYGGDNVITTYINTAGGGTIYNYFDYTTYGLTGFPNYAFPVGNDSYKRFMTTQYEQYQSSKIASGTQALFTTILGGVQMAGGNSGAGGAVVGGATTMASNITNAIALKKDLKNTPDSICSLGSSLVHDYSISNDLLPFLIFYKPSMAEQEMLLDYFYNYGYYVNRECYLNQELDVTNDYENDLDKRIFTRQLFNYVKTNDEIASKMFSLVMPPVVKKKIENIFNNGIKLWTFFEIVRYDNDELNYAIDNYLYKNKYENVEIV